MLRSVLHRPWLLAAAALAVLGLPQFVAAQDAASEPVYLDEPDPAPAPTVVREVPAVEKYEDGKMRVERNVQQLSDDQIVNHGKYTEYYRNGNKFAEGVYQQGVHQGPWSFWHENGQLAKQVNFKNSQPDGAWESFRADGTLMSKKEYKDGKREGKWIVYHADGKTPRAEQSYAGGKQHGQSTIYFANGKPWQEVMFADGLADGPVLEFDESGRKVLETTFKAGKLHGTRTRWNPDGTTTVQQYVEGKPVAGSAVKSSEPATQPGA